MLVNPEVLPRAPRTSGRLVACCCGRGPAARGRLRWRLAKRGENRLLLEHHCGRRDGSATVTINAAKQYQRIAGFGVSEGFGQAKALMNAPASVQQQVLSLLYSPTRGAGLTILRNEISADTGFTIEPRAPSSPPARRRI